jgi:hypothetical protein
MDANLEYFLSRGPYTAKDLARLLGRSETWVRDSLKKEIGFVKCKKNSTGSNVFWIGGPSEDEPASEHQAQNPASEHQAENPVDCGQGLICPHCQSKGLQVPAGPEGTFLGAVWTCTDCNTSYNQFTHKVVDLEGAFKKRKAPLNPQYKINAKTQAMKAVGGSVRFDKTDRVWSVEKANGDQFTFTAAEFSELTSQTILEL